MLTRRVLLILCLLLVFARAGHAQVFGTVRVSARDEQNLALPGAQAIIKSITTTWTQTATTNAGGEVVFSAVPIGQYNVSVALSGFQTAEKRITVMSSSVTPVQISLSIGGMSQTVDVTAELQTINPESSKTQTMVSRSEILRTPDADSTGSMAMVTNNVPGAYMMHDHLHSRGGHGVTWEIDGVPVPNSNLATVGAQFDPKDVDSLEVDRGGLSSNYGDRSYGVFNVVPRSGFEGHRFADASLSYGTYRHANGYFSFGDHTEDQKFALFASGSGNRTDRGLERVDIPQLNNEAWSGSGFTSLIYNPSARNQLRVVASVRRDAYNVPNTVAQHELGIRDREIATDAFSNVTWVHTSESGTLLTVSPYYHYNRGRYLGGPKDPIVTTDNRGSHYLGTYVNVAVFKGEHSIRFGTDLFTERNDSLFGLKANDGTGLELSQRELLWANVLSAFVDESYRATTWLTLNGGLRFQHFSGTLTERALSPRLGFAAKVPRVGVLRGSYSRYYQHPQTSTISGPILQFAVHEGFDFLPLPGERDSVWEVGLGIPVRSWTLDFDTYDNRTRNAVDHAVLGNSNLLFPLTIERGRIRAFESTLRSPFIRKVVQFHYALAYQIAQGKGKVTGGLTDFLPPADDYFYLDHDQRVTVTAGAQVNLPAHLWTSATILYGSGFLKGNGPDHMPRHTTFDVAFGKDFAGKLSLRLSALNVANRLYMTGLGNSFAGTHYANPREVSMQVRYKFHY